MANYGDGIIEIPLEELWNFVENYNIHTDYNVFYGVPRVNNDNNTLEIDYMFNSEIEVSLQGDFEESKCYKQWEELKSK